MSHPSMRQKVMFADGRACLESVLASLPRRTPSTEVLWGFARFLAGIRQTVLFFLAKTHE